MVVSRTSSASSSSSSVDANVFNAAEQRRTRRRITATQLAHLEELYRQTSHPSRDQRDALAKRIQMETKSVTIWFQNKRQTDRKVALHNATNSQNAVTKCVGSMPTLDRVASRSQIRFTDAISSTSTTPPVCRTPSPPASSTPSTTHPPLWSTMLSSPLAPSSPPSADFVAFIRARKPRTLDWACVAAGLTRDGDQPSASPASACSRASLAPLVASPPVKCLREYEEATATTETEDEAELVTPSSSQDVPLPWGSTRSDANAVSGFLKHLVHGCRPMHAAGFSFIDLTNMMAMDKSGWEEDEMHAALALCGLRG